MLAYIHGPVIVTHVSVHMHSPQPCFPAVLNWFIQPMHLSILKAISHPGIQLWTCLYESFICWYAQPFAMLLCNTGSVQVTHALSFNSFPLSLLSYYNTADDVCSAKKAADVHPCNHRSILASHAFSESCNCPSRLLYSNVSSLATNPSLHTVTTSHQLMNIHSSR